MKRIVAAISVAVIAIILFWYFTNYFVAIFATKYQDLDLAHLGSVGDTFGVTTSLFSGLGAIGIVAVIAIEQRARRLNQQPFLVLSELKTLVTFANIDESVARLDMRFTCNVSNATSDPCINPSFDFVSVDGMIVDFGYGSGPIVAGPRTELKVELTASGNSAQNIFEKLARGEALGIDMVMSYESLNGTRWRTKAKLAPKSKHPADKTRWRGISEGNKDDFVLKATPGKSDQIDLATDFAPGSWSHAELLRKRRQIVE